MNFLPGWNPPIVNKAAIHLAQVLSATGAPAAIAPNGILAGDLIILGAGAASTGSNSPDFAAPSGFTEITVVTHSISRVTRAGLWYKVASGTEDGSTLNPFTDPSDARATHCVVFRPTQEIGNVSVVDFDSITSVSNPDAIVLDPGTEFNVAFTIYSGAENATAPDISSRTMSPTEDNETGPENDTESTAQVDTAFKWKVFNPPDTAVNVTSDIGDAGISTIMVTACLLVTQ